MQVSIDVIQGAYGASYAVTAVIDKFHKPLVREYFSYSDALSLATQLLEEKLDPAISAMFKRRS